MTIEEYAKLAKATDILAKKAQWEDILKKVEEGKDGNVIIIFNQGKKNEQRLNTGLGESDFGKTIYEGTISAIKGKIAYCEKEFAEL